MTSGKTCLLILVTVTAFGCQDLPRHYFSPKPDCKTMTIQEADPLSGTYQRQATDILQTKRPEDFRYFFKTFTGDNMLVNFRNDSLCFDVKMRVESWEKLEGMRKTNGQSYPEELYNLTWRMEDNEVVYMDMYTVID